MKAPFIVIALILFGCGEETTIEKSTPIAPKKEINTQPQINQHEDKATSKPTSKQSAFVAKPFYEPETGWGYDIFEGEKLMVHQPHIPAIQGNIGFESADQAINVANKVIEKMEAGVMPPSLSIPELKQLGVNIP